MFFMGTIKTVKVQHLTRHTLPDPVRMSKDGGCHHCVACIDPRGKQCLGFWAANKL